MKYLILVIALLPFVYGLTNQQYASEFTSFMHKFDKSYDHDEFQVRFQTFKENLDFINEHNAQEDKTFTVAVNDFAAMTNEEYVKTFLGFAGDKVELNQPLSPVVVSNVGIPASKDWRKEGAVTHVKNQGQCGSCWSFSTTGSVEGSHKLGGHTLVSLSEQQLVDCSQSYGNMGCDGGLMDDAFKYILDSSHGLESESAYPYTAEDGTCHFNSKLIVADIDGYHDVPSGNEHALTNDIADIGPISVAIDASHSSFQFYSSGVYYEPDCSSTQLDHGVLAVGYGVDSGKDYYIVKNSWGTDWGMNGYIWMSRFRDNNCGIATMASYPCNQGQANCPA